MEDIIGFRYAFLSKGKSWEVVFWQINPYKGDLMERVRIRLNNIPASNRERYGLKYVDKINNKLDAGWNYFVEKYKGRKLVECIAEYIQDVKLKKRPATYNSYNSRFNLFLKWLKQYYPKLVYIHEVNTTIAEEYFLWLQTSRNYSNTTYNGALLDFKTLWNNFNKRKLVNINPFTGLTPYPQDEKFRTFINRRDLRLLFNHLSKHDKNFLIVCGLTFYGLIRRTEICKLQLFMVDWQKRIIKISGSISKTRKNKIVIIPDALYDLLIEHEYHLLPSAYFICSKNFAPGPEKIHPPRISEKFRKVCDALEFPKAYQFYSLKDTGTTFMEEAGLSSAAIRDQAGWKTIQMQDHYSHTTGEALEKLRGFTAD